MIDFGLDKIALIGAVALVVIGPEKLPKVARIVGHLVGKAQRYVADVKAEVNRSMELEELRGMKTQFETAARDVHTTVHRELGAARRGVQGQWQQAQDALSPPVAASSASAGSTGAADSHDSTVSSSSPVMRPIAIGGAPSARRRKNWRVKRAAVPAWYKQREGVRMHAQSGAARVARFRPPRSG